MSVNVLIHSYSYTLVRSILNELKPGNTCRAHAHLEKSRVADAKLGAKFNPCHSLTLSLDQPAQDLPLLRVTTRCLELRLDVLNYYHLYLTCISLLVFDMYLSSLSWAVKQCSNIVWLSLRVKKNLQRPLFVVLESQGRQWGPCGLVAFYHMRFSFSTCTRFVLSSAWFKIYLHAVYFRGWSSNLNPKKACWIILGWNHAKFSSMSILRAQ